MKAARNGLRNNKFENEIRNEFILFYNCKCLNGRQLLVENR
jgi:hypothetical protein